MNAAAELLRQHLIDPEICIRCNTCEETCPIDAITHDSRNYVVDADICNGCMACVPPCPTGAIDSWRLVARAQAYGLDEQLGWDELPAEQPLTEASEMAAAAVAAELPMATAAGPSATVPPWSAAHPYVNLYTHKAPVTATVVGNYRVTGTDTDSDIRHIVLDFGAQPFPVLEGQSIGILPPGTDVHGRTHHARQYSLASPRDGERAGYNNLSITVKRVTEGHDGQAVRGVCSNYLCDLVKGDVVQVIGPFGNTFLMPNHPGANLMMICTGTGAAPMRAMTENSRRRLAQGGLGRLMLFFCARTERELPYFGPLMKLPADFIDINLALSRDPGQPKRYVQDAIRQRAQEVLGLLTSGDTYIYVCGLKGMEQGVLQVMADIAQDGGHDWAVLSETLRREGRMHFETY
ncbi:benzoyl-CoA 2,3-epoxidase subunit BoxA [Bordetella holmesii]|uniref:Benzoyl-CoA oxygenase component A n=2 Tax=Bordetella holmesii TaxID=35814 RepID=A0A158M6E0_9BORD|nr:benzoyl-CoA 2,3-epoxidase subunit BoxA [Bordetella holmesii]AHV92587.1 benzoyl-CoA oxygenase/reductase, BoxA protein [Bordetella holmesii ATCC 51541]AIT26677.1 benzoyl-CoA oxygenase/reductase, BoxA protein [Bordetella holmesii 44057]EWM42564.1 benzoyl-CoA oxygenase/reductase, BoxA protein [Bordetella holmesii 41130]EWM47260.1 benzoyl-CoA oxygenase/reductase, BoxA protein [Bordetella holmesii 35009]AMD45644.1 benzoyl-CoA oxygenase [Bordetella holmesii H558]